jgi:glycosyltransferase involved in cell wall biosynthesis
LRFHIVGPDGGEDPAADTASEHVVFHGFVEDLPGFMEGMDIACLPTRLGWGCKLKMAEALARGLPAVGAPATFRGVPDTPDAFIVCRSVRDYVGAFRQLLDDDFRAALGTQGREMYRQWVTNGETLLEAALHQAKAL